MQFLHPVPLAPYGVALLIFAAPGPAAGAVVQHLHFFRVHQADHIEHAAQLVHQGLQLVVRIALARHLAGAGQAWILLRGQDTAQKGGIHWFPPPLGEQHPQEVVAQCSSPLWSHSRQRTFTSGCSG